MKSGQAVRLVVNKDGTVGVGIMANDREHSPSETFAFATFAEASAFVENEMFPALADARVLARTIETDAQAAARLAPAPGKKEGETDLDYSRRVATERENLRGRTLDERGNPRNVDDRGNPQNTPQPAYPGQPPYPPISAAEAEARAAEKRARGA